ncbi:MAG: Fic family protein [Planctomycetes bacterium]|nr:Fic family protein [Planctomycetota bacterium]
MDATGSYIETAAGGESVKAFVPAPLPAGCPLELPPEYMIYLEEANRALGRLDGTAMLLPDPSLFIYFYVRKEAVLSSQIEGTQSSLSDLILYESKETPGVPLDDVEEVSNYVAAMNYGMKRMREDKFPLSLRLLKEIHNVLLSKGRGSNKTPGDFRRSQNWLGGTRPGNAKFIPPPPNMVTKCMGELEDFLHDKPIKLSPLLKAALAHVQFETIHPFLDGNGRLGRLLIALILTSEKALGEPLLYLSLYFKKHREVYYECLQNVRTKGDWLGWIRFFLEGVKVTADQATEKSKSILALFSEDEKSIGTLGRKTSSAYKIHEYLQHHPILSIPAISSAVGLSQPTVTGVVKALEELGILKESTGKQRDRIYVYAPYMKLLAESDEE